MEINKSETQTAKERTYIVAGLITKAYHDLPEITAAVEENGDIKVGGMTIVPADASLSLS